MRVGNGAGPLYIAWQTNEFPPRPKLSGVTALEAITGEPAQSATQNMAKAATDGAFKAYVKRAVAPAAGDGASEATVAKYTLARALADEAAASAAERWLAGQNEGFMVALASADSVRFGRGAPWRLSLRGRNVGTVLLNPTPVETQSGSMAIRLALINGSEDRTLLADAVIYDGVRRVINKFANFYVCIQSKVAASLH